MPRDLASFQRWVRQIYATQDVEADCNEFFQAVPAYVERQVSDQDAHLVYPEIALHLTQCPGCKDLYLTLSDAARLESQEL